MGHKISRRDFGRLTTVGLSAWGTLCAGSPPSANDKLNIGCIGAGGKGETNILGVLRENVVAIAEVDDERGSRGFKLAPKAKRYKDYREMLDKERLDAVVVSTPDHHHAPAALMAMRMGKHVYCEKPLAHSIYAARLMRRIAREQKVATQMGNQGHSGPILREAVEVIRSGAIGAVRELHAWTNRPKWPQGLDQPKETMPSPASLDWDLWLGPAAERPYHDAYCPFKWRGWWDFGTGALGDMACHILDLGFWALDLEYPTAVEAESSGVLTHSAPIWSVIRYDFPARGSQPAVKLTWYDGGKKPDPAIVGLTQLPDGGSILVGDQGMMYVPSDYGSQYILLPKEKFEGYNPPPPNIARATTLNLEVPVAAAHYVEWLKACKGGPAALSSFDYAALLTEVVLLGNVALRTGQQIHWDGPAGKAKNCPAADAFIEPMMRKGWDLL
jgi:predicted dehydrogenase